MEIKQDIKNDQFLFTVVWYQLTAFVKTVLAAKSRQDMMSKFSAKSLINFTAAVEFSAL